MITGIKKRWKRFWSDFRHTVSQKLFPACHLELISTTDPSSQIQKLGEALEGKDVDGLYRIQSCEISVEPDRIRAVVIAYRFLDKAGLHSLAEAEILSIRNEPSGYITRITVVLGELLRMLIAFCLLLLWPTILSIGVIIATDLRLDVVTTVLMDVNNPLLAARWGLICIISLFPALLFLFLVYMLRAFKKSKQAQTWLLAYCRELFNTEN